MSLEDKYLASGKNTNAAAYPGQSIQTNDHSIYNIDHIPNKYNTAGRLGSLKDTSIYNIDHIPNKYNTKYNTAGRLGSLKDTSIYNIDTIPTKYHG